MLDESVDDFARPPVANVKRDIGVAIPTHQREEHLGRMLDSIPARIGIWVSDNGATLSAEFVSRRPSIAFIRQNPSIPIYANWNAAARAASSEWVLVPSDDDFYYDHAFESIEKATRDFADADIIVFGHNLIDQSDVVLSSWKPGSLEKLSSPDGFERFAFGVEARMLSIVFRRSLLEKLNYFDEAFELTASDSDLVQRASLNGTVVLVPEIIAAYRTWPGNLTNRTISSAQWMQDIDHWAKNIRLALSKQPRLASSAKLIGDSLYADNLRVGIKQLRSQTSWRSAWSHFRRCRYPRHATMKLQLALFYHLFGPKR